MTIVLTKQSKRNSNNIKFVLMTIVFFVSFTIFAGNIILNVSGLPNGVKLKVNDNWTGTDNSFYIQEGENKVNALTEKYGYDSITFPRYQESTYSIPFAYPSTMLTVYTDKSYAVTYSTLINNNTFIENIKNNKYPYILGQGAHVSGEPNVAVVYSYDYNCIDSLGGAWQLEPYIKQAPSNIKFVFINTPWINEGSNYAAYYEYEIFQGEGNHLNAFYDYFCSIYKVNNPDEKSITQDIAGKIAANIMTTYGITSSKPISYYKNIVNNQDALMYDYIGQGTPNFVVLSINNPKVSTTSFHKGAFGTSSEANIGLNKYISARQATVTN